MKYLAVLLIGLWMFSACGDDQDMVDEETIIDYLLENNLEAQSLESGLFYIIDEPGSDSIPDITNVVEVTYIGTYMDGSEFDRSPINGTAEFPLSGVIEGWQQGIPLFGEGGSGKLIIPSNLGYGSNPPPGIRKNAVLIFDIELIRIVE